MNTKTISVMAAIGVIAVVVILSQSKMTSAPEAGVTPGGAANVAGIMAPAATPSVKEFTVTGKNFSFMPAMLNVKLGDTVKITFKNTDGFHDFKIDGFYVATERISGGSEATVTFVADKIGSFEYYCSVGNHRAMGMKGTLLVE